MRFNEIIGEEEDYRGEHQAPDKKGGAPLWDVSLNGIYPADYYTGYGRDYTQGYGPGDSFSYDLTWKYHNIPNASVKIYRAIPKDLPKTTINKGDWVALSKAYCLDHGRTNLRNDFRIISKTVSARDVFTDGNSICEWGYDPQPYDPTRDIEIRRRRALVFELPEDEKQKFRAIWKNYQGISADRWNKLFQDFKDGKIS